MVTAKDHFKLIFKAKETMSVAQLSILLADPANMDEEMIRRILSWQALGTTLQGDCIIMDFQMVHKIRVALMWPI